MVEVEFDPEARIGSEKVCRLSGGCSKMQLWRYCKDPKYAHLNFPKPVKVGNRNYWRLGSIIKWWESQTGEAA